MITTACKIDGIDFRLDYKKHSLDNSFEYSGILHIKNEIVFSFSEGSFSPSDIEPAYIDAIKKAISIQEQFNAKHN
ncbi:MAG TPA: hypothetical protein VKR32_07330 [Puia sp.]|nr:hypothetical protein [Puia sp.]